jgi:hypothetical protein
MKGIRWYLRHAWVRAVKLRNRIDAKVHHKKAVVLQVQDITHTLNFNFNGGKPNAEIHTR